MGSKGFDDRVKRNCNPSVSQLFCVNNIGAVRFEGEEDELVLWQDLATLKLCGENCSQVLHTVSGNIHAVFTGDNDVAAVADFQFRILDSFGREVCTRRIRYAAELPDEENTEIIFPFTFTCCDELRGCDSRQQFRLQADLLDERLALNNDVWIQDLDWSAIVWEADRRF
ncbi:MAG TPA: hypothetical protein GXZ82_09200 [Firmicutes bacterium]|nr:hypothetical protein [Bacillota bacterium]